MKKQNLTQKSIRKGKEAIMKHHCGTFEKSRRITLNLHGPFYKKTLVKNLNTFTRLIKFEILNGC